MDPIIEERLVRLETLCAEQDHLIEGLNDALARQDSELLRLQRELENVEARLRAIRANSSDIDPGHEKPPHY